MGGLDLLEQRLRGDGGVHQLAQNYVRLLPDLWPGVSQPVQDRAQDGVQVRLELRCEPVYEKSDNVQTILGNLQL